MRSLSLPAVPNFINSLELLVSTVMYSFDPCFTVKAPEALSTVPISTVLDTFTKVVDEWLSQVNVPKDPSPLKVCLLI